MNRRHFIASTVLAGPAGVSRSRAATAPSVLGQGDFLYRIVPGWGVLGEDTPVMNCHGIVEDEAGHIILLTDEVRNNVIIYDKDGKLLQKWGTTFPGAHGLSIVKDGTKQVLYLTDLKRNAFFKTSLDGEVLGEWHWPADSGKYEKQDQYRPSWTLHAPDGRFFTLDGYGRDYIQCFGADGKATGLFGGAEGGISHWGPHGGIYDNGLLIAMSDQQYLMKLDDAGKEQFRVAMPGGNPRQIEKKGDHYFIAHLADNWPANRDSCGFLSVLGSDFKILSNIGGTPPEYDDAGKLRKMTSVGADFIHPHDLVVARDESIYVAQFASGNTYPIKLERV